MRRDVLISAIYNNVYNTTTPYTTTYVTTNEINYLIRFSNHGDTLSIINHITSGHPLKNNFHRLTTLLIVAELQVLGYEVQDITYDTINTTKLKYDKAE